MGSWTANYQLYLAAAGEQGWADAINGNFDAIDTELKTQTGAIAAASLTAEWDKIAGKPTIYPSTWNEISGKPDFSIPTYKGFQLIQETPQTTPFNATGKISNNQTVTIATVNGYVIDAPVVLNVNITRDNLVEQHARLTLFAGDSSSSILAVGLSESLNLNVPVGQRISTISLQRTGPGYPTVTYTCTGTISTKKLAFVAL